MDLPDQLRERIAQRDQARVTASAAERAATMLMPEASQARTQAAGHVPAHEYPATHFAIGDARAPWNQRVPVGVFDRLSRHLPDTANAVISQGDYKPHGRLADRVRRAAPSE